MRRYRHQDPSKFKINTTPQLHKLFLFAIVLCMNENALKEIPQEPYIESWGCGKVVVEIINFALARLPGRTNDQDLLALESSGLTGNEHTAACARILERENLLKWRHAICVQYDLYRYEKEAELQSVPFDSQKICYTCMASIHLRKCTRCREIRYCSVECQREDWPEHKELCDKWQLLRKK